MEYGGTAVAGGVNAFLTSSKAPSTLKNIKYLPEIVNGVWIAADLFLGEHIRGWAGQGLDGAAVGAGALLVNKLTKDALDHNASGTTTTGSTSASTGSYASEYLTAPAASQQMDWLDDYESEPTFQAS